MKAIQFTPVAENLGLAVTVQEPLGADSTHLVVLRDGQLTAVPVDHGGDLMAGVVDSILAIAFLRWCGRRSDPAWFLAPISRRLAVNGWPPLPLACIAPGDLVSVGERYWFVANLQSPEPTEAPEEMQSQMCPVCGAELGLATVAQCQGCGRLAHLERPDAPNDPDALNCFLVAGVCGQCNQPLSLAPQALPEPPRELVCCDDEMGDEPW